MKQVFLGLLPLAFMAIGVVFVMLFFYVAISRFGQKKRKSPFVGLFLRAPGHTLNTQVDDAVMDLMGLFMVSMLLPLIVIVVPLMQASTSGKAIGIGSWILYGLMAAAGLVWLGIKMYRQVHKVRNLRLGYEGEVGVGQELNQLMPLGFRVFHDFPADKFNIDHVVIGRTGVFAVETKARAKPDTGDGRQDSRLDYDGHSLRFPGWTEKEPIEQATRQAQWLSKWLTSAVGELVPVVAVVAVPGWFITRTKPAQVLVYNGKRPDKVFPQYSGKPLEPAMIQRIAHQVEAKCRDVAPRAYVKDPKPASA